MAIDRDFETDKGCPHCCTLLIQTAITENLYCPTASRGCGYEWDKSENMRSAATPPPLEPDELKRAKLTNPIYRFQTDFAKSFANLVEVYDFDFACLQLDFASKAALMNYDTARLVEMYDLDMPKTTNTKN